MDTKFQKKLNKVVTYYKKMQRDLESRLSQEQASSGSSLQKDSRLLMVAGRRHSVCLSKDQLEQLRITFFYIPLQSRMTNDIVRKLTAHFRQVKS